jgi:hypothetical protein
MLLPFSCNHDIVSFPINHTYISTDIAIAIATATATADLWCDQEPVSTS